MSQNRYKSRLIFPIYAMLCVAGCSAAPGDRESVATTRSELGEAGNAGEGGHGGEAGAGDGATGPGGAPPSGGAAGMGANGGTVVVGACPAVPASDPLIYDGGGSGPLCYGGLVGHTGVWFASHDDAGTLVASDLNGELSDGNSRCAMHTAGDGFAQWGGTGFVLDLPWGACPYDASAFAGVRLKLKGFTQNTADACGPKENVVFIKLGTVATTPTDAGGTCVPPTDPNAPGCWDDFGAYCTLDSEWSECSVWFDRVKQGGWGQPATFDPAEILMISALALTNGAGTLNWNFWIDDVAFIPEGAIQPPADPGCSSGGTGGSGGMGATGNEPGAGRGGATAIGGNSAGGSGGTVAGKGGSAGEAAAPIAAEDEGGCSCRLPARPSRDRWSLGLALLGLALGRRLLRRPSSAPEVSS